MTSDEKIDLVLTWYDWFYDNTDTFEGDIGWELAYLWPAMLRGATIDVTEESEIVKLLRENQIPATSSIWLFLEFEEAQ